MASNRVGTVFLLATATVGVGALYLGLRREEARAPLGGPLAGSGAAADDASYYVVHAIESSRTVRGAPHLQSLLTALSPPRLAWPTPADGWIGPRPRVTRAGPLLGLQTHVTWVIRMSPATVARATARGVSLQAEIERVVSESLRRIEGSNWVQVRVTPYDPAAHGALSWWLDSSPGGASGTRTGDQPDLTGVTVENPTGPNDRRLTSGGFFGDGSVGVIEQLTALARTAAWVVVPLSVVIVIGKLAPSRPRFYGSSGRQRQELSSHNQPTAHTPQDSPATLVPQALSSQPGLGGTSQGAQGVQ